MKTDKNGFGNGLKRYKTLIKTYKEPRLRYQRYILASFRKNSSNYITQSNRNQKVFRNSLQNAIFCRILPQNDLRLASNTLFNIPSARILPSI